MPSKNLVIVESPAKAKTISKYLGKDYTVLASFGHVRDLPSKEMGVEIDKGFKPKYILSDNKNHKKAIKEIKAAYTKDKTKIYIATDQDREGEAIGWHLLQILKVKDKDIEKTSRIVFHEITKPAILSAINNPVALNIDLVNAQQARRILDRLVGYELSPLLWKKVRYGLSAGRVQSVAVRLIVEKEQEIKAFNIEEYWSIESVFTTIRKDNFQAKLLKHKGKNIKISNEKEAKKIVDTLKKEDYTITKVETKDTKRNPAPPFITSTLQQEASRKLGFNVDRTMRIAQQLYEGMDLGHGTEGLITYMRTDSVNLSKVALEACKKVITDEYGKEYALDKPRFYKGRKGAQEAHEAIRPVNVHYVPKNMKKHLNEEQFKLYQLIWKRTLACQMEQAKLKNTSVDITTGEYIFRATGQQIAFPGFMKLYIEQTDNSEEDTKQNDENILPEINQGESADLKKITPNQHFTKPPARFTEASLVKKLEELGIGRPSTYAPTISTIQTRGYIEKENKQLIPTDTAFVVTHFLIEHFANIVDYPFTANMEDTLDGVAEGKGDWVKSLEDFYTPFHKNIEDKTESVSKSDVIARELGTDPKTKLPVLALLGRFGPYVKLGDQETPKEKVKSASIEAPDTFESVDIKRALEILNSPNQKKDGRELGTDPETKQTIRALVGRFGPYIKLGEEKKAKMVSVIPPFEYDTIDLEGCFAAFAITKGFRSGWWC